MSHTRSGNPPGRPTPRRRWLFPAILLLAPLALLAQAGGAPPPAGVATVRVTPHIDGNVGFSVDFDDQVPESRAARALDVLAREVLRCDWERESAWSGTCRKMLPSDGSRVEGQLNLASLVIGLHGWGVREVRVDVEATGTPEAGRYGAWRQRSTTSGLFFKSKSEFYEFVSASFMEFPPGFTVQIGEPWNPAHAATPVVFVLFGPALLALYLRRRDERRGTTGSAMVWLNWVLTGSFLYWVTALSLSDVFVLAVRLGLTNSLAVLALGVALFSLPILLATAVCTLILSPPSHAESLADRVRLLGMVVLQQAVYLVPLGVFVSATGMMEYSRAIAIAGLPAAFVLYRIMRLCAQRYRVGGFQALTSGDLYQRISALARTAGTRLNGVFILGNRRAAEANASANSKGFITLTRGLVENLTRREVDAAAAHEVGHLRGRHPSLQMWLLVAYFALRIPAGALLPRTGPAALLLSLPIFPIVYVLVAARVSQRHEFNADMRAVALTGDPEGKIAALARLRRLGKSPVDWGGIQGSILSHPSMRQRVLALGNRYGVPPERALAILADPDAIAPTPGVPRHYDLPAEVRDTGLVFTSSAKATYSQLAFWAMQAVLVAILTGMAYVSDRIMSVGFNALLLLASIPAAAWLYLRIAHASDYLFRRWLESRIRRRIPCAEGAVFVGLLPGEVLRPYEGGFYEWDLGLVSLESGWLAYSGERTRFSLPRAEIVGFAVRNGPLAWLRQHAVLVRHTRGAFLLHPPGYSWWRARRLEKKLTAWWRGGAASPEVPGAQPLPPPDLPALAFSSPSRWKVAWRFGKVAFFQFFGLGIALAALGHTSADNPLYSLLILVVPLTYLLAVAPVLFRRGA